MISFIRRRDSAFLFDNGLRLVALFFDCYVLAPDANVFTTSHERNRFGSNRVEACRAARANGLEFGFANSSFLRRFAFTLP